MSIYILHLGSNIGNRQGNLETSISQIEEMGSKVLAKSGLYETEPWGFATDDLFLNQAIKVDSSLHSEDLLDALLGIEKTMGRERVLGDYASRIIDIDILFHENEVSNTEKLVLPHPHIQARRFVLAPLLDIASEFVHPVLDKTSKQMYNECTDNSKVYLYTKTL